MLFKKEISKFFQLLNTYINIEDKRMKREWLYSIGAVWLMNDTRRQSYHIN